MPKLDDITDCCTCDLTPPLSAEEKFVQFTDYIFKRYIYPNATLPSSLWADFSANGSQITNNCKSFHSKLNSSFYPGHPNIYYLIDISLDIQAGTYTHAKVPMIFRQEDN